MSKARLSSKGQLTVPADIRLALGLKKGDTVAFEVRPEGALLRKVGDASALRGSVGPKKVEWKSARRRAWRARVERLARSSATRMS